MRDVFGTTRNKNHPGVSYQDRPGKQHDRSTSNYREQRHKLFGALADERVPSAGWRSVYAAMSVKK